MNVTLFVVFLTAEVCELDQRLQLQGTGAGKITL